ncbi:MAG: PadR family transcriptional regulator [Desulfurococcales archaeon]|nr:PadR family transcriptional regulator [Desulfurococcales archaeon]
MRGVERLLRDLRTGLLAVASLKVLVERGPMHGYGVRLVLGELLGWEPPESSVYDALKRLERLGLAESYWVRSSMGTLRKYYKATPRGVEALEDLVAEARRLMSWLVCR